jgi:diguanylate cyclase (GGDEF)-like protein
MYDLDNFKEINETCGHVYADSVLVRVAETLRETFRDADTVARYGGDEMIVLAHVSALEDAMQMARRSIERVREAVGVNISAGVSVYPLSAATMESAVTEADAALGRAKRGGKARAMLAAPAA